MIRAVVFDWAGTVIDHGSLAPALAFVRCFESFGLPLTLDQARGPMGRAKADHVAALLDLFDGPRPSVEEVMERFTPMTIEAALARADLIPGAAEVLAALRLQGIRIGSTTGYTRPIIEALRPLAAAQGFAPDSLVCAEETAEGRPSPLMMWRVMADLGVWPAHHVVKVDDTEVGLAEGRNAGTWTLGVALSGNALGLSLAELQALPPAEFDRRAALARQSLSTAHEVIDTVRDLPAALARLNARLAAGERP